MDNHYTGRALFQNPLSAIPENELPISMPSIKIVFQLRAFHIYIYIYIYVYIFIKSSFPKHDLQTWHGHCNIDFWIGA